MPLTRITSNVITDGTIVNADISSSTLIDRAKLQLSPPAGVKTVYLAPRTDGIEGTGSESDPYDAGGATEAIAATKYDAIINNRTKCPDDCVIRLMPGNYFTRGVNYYPAGQYGPINDPTTKYPYNCSVIGSGMNTTKLKIIDGFTPFYNGDKYNPIIIHGEPSLAPVVRTNYKQAIISDFTVDANWNNLRRVGTASGGVTLWNVYYGIIRNIWVINNGGDLPTLFEAFSGSIWDFTLNDGFGLIDSCISTNEVEGIGNTDPYVSGFGAGGNQSIVQNCIVIGGTPNFSNTLASGGNARFFRNNLIINKASGTYQDSYTSEDLWVLENYYINCPISIHFQAIVPLTDRVKRVVAEKNTMFVPNVGFQGPFRSIDSSRVVFNHNIIRPLTGSFIYSPTMITGASYIEFKNNVSEKGCGQLLATNSQGNIDQTPLFELEGDIIYGEGGDYVRQWVTQAPTLSITRNGNLATAVLSSPLSRELRSGWSFLISDANQQEYNGIKEITVVNQTTVTFPVYGNPATPATTGSTIKFALPNGGGNLYTVPNFTPNPAKRGKLLKDLLLASNQTQSPQNTYTCILEPGEYFIAPETLQSFLFKSPIIIGNGNREDIIINLTYQTYDPTNSWGIYFNAATPTFKNLTLKGFKKAGTTGYLFRYDNNPNPVFENCIIDGSGFDYLGSALNGTYKNCLINGNLEPTGDRIRGKFYDCTISGSFSGFVSPNSYNEIVRCTINNSSNMNFSGKIEDSRINYTGVGVVVFALYDNTPTPNLIKNCIFNKFFVRLSSDTTSFYDTQFLNSQNPIFVGHDITPPATTRTVNLSNVTTNLVSPTTSAITKVNLTNI